MAHLSRVMDDKAREVFLAKKAAFLNGSTAGGISVAKEGSREDIMSVLSGSSKKALGLWTSMLTEI